MAVRGPPSPRQPTTLPRRKKRSPTLVIPSAAEESKASQSQHIDPERQTTFAPTTSHHPRTNPYGPVRLPLRSDDSRTVLPTPNCSARPQRKSFQETAGPVPHLATPFSSENACTMQRPSGPFPSLLGKVRMRVHPHPARPIPRSNRIKTSYPALALSEHLYYNQPMETQVALSPPHRSICCLTPLWVQSLPRTRYGGHALVAGSCGHSHHRRVREHSNPPSLYCTGKALTCLETASTQLRRRVGNALSTGCPSYEVRQNETVAHFSR